MAFKKSTSINLADPTAIFTGSAIIAGAIAQAEFGSVITASNSGSHDMSCCRKFYYIMATF